QRLEHVGLIVRDQDARGLRGWVNHVETRSKASPASLRCGRSSRAAVPCSSGPDGNSGPAPPASTDGGKNPGTGRSFADGAQPTPKPCSSSSEASSAALGP